MFEKYFLVIPIIFRFWEEPLWTLFLSSFFSQFRYIILTFFWHFLTFFPKNFKYLKTCQICDKMYIIALKCTSIALKCTFFDNFLKTLNFQKKCQICYKMNILLWNVHHCSQMYNFWHLKKLQIFENMSNLPQNEILLSNVYLLHKFKIWNLPRRNRS